ncbi:MAG: hypothetical protein MJY88_01820 [Bacteroidales bacterium]|nr:hypothetical protein [Bacteroidales bacterium]
MKKILEIIQYGEHDIRFNTDIDVLKRPQEVEAIISKTMFAMATKLWGGNEQSVIAMIRAMAIADLAISTKRDAMIKELDESSKAMGKAFMETMKALNGKGGVSVQMFGPGIPRPKKS